MEWIPHGRCGLPPIHIDHKVIYWGHSSAKDIWNWVSCLRPMCLRANALPTELPPLMFNLYWVLLMRPYVQNPICHHSYHPSRRGKVMTFCDIIVEGESRMTSQQCWHWSILPSWSISAPGTHFKNQFGIYDSHTNMVIHKFIHLSLHSNLLCFIQIRC